MKKILNGQLVDMTAADAAELQAAWDAWAAGKPARDADAARVAAVDDAIGADATVTALKGMTNAEFSAWFAANVTTLAQARNVLERLARIVIRRVL